MSTDGSDELLREKYEKALDLLERATSLMEDGPPDASWFKEYFLLTGAHMVRTEEGWVSAASYLETGDEYKPRVVEEVNAPNGVSLMLISYKAEMWREAREGSQVLMGEDVYEIAEVLTHGLHLTLDGEDRGVFSYEHLFQHGAVLQHV